MIAVTNRTNAARVAPRTVLASMVGLWLCYFVLATARAGVIGFDLQGDLLWRRALVTVAGIAVTMLLWLVLRVFDRHSLATKIAAALIASLPGAMLIAQVNTMAFAPVEDRILRAIGREQGLELRRDEAGNLLVDIPQAVERAPRSLTLARASTEIDRWRQLTDVALGRYFLLLAWAALYFALQAGAQARLAERRAGEFRRAAKTAELQSLRYQVNPHLLFNALNSLSALVITGRRGEAEEMIQNISSFYRRSLTGDPTEDVELQEEFALQRHYLEIEAVRFPERLRTQFDLPRALAEVRVPGMILQPLVENSVRYAVAQVSRPVTLRLSARVEDGMLVLSVTDDGPGLPDGAQPGFGIGLANVRDRLRARFGERARVEARALETGFRTQLHLPVGGHRGG